MNPYLNLGRKREVWERIHCQGHRPHNITDRQLEDIIEDVLTVVGIFNSDGYVMPTNKAQSVIYRSIHDEVHKAYRPVLESLERLQIDTITKSKLDKVKQKAKAAARR